MPDVRTSDWWRLARHALPVYVISRLCVLSGAAVVAAELRVDANIAIENDLPLADPQGAVNMGSATRPMLDVLTSWDGLWYMDIVRNGYPRAIPPAVTYNVDEARAAFFPVFPMMGRVADALLPGGDSFGVLLMNAVVGFVAVVLIGLLGQRWYGERVGRTTITLVALFPGSFVLSFAYSEAIMIALAAACLLALHERSWLLAGVLAAFATATRPNGLALVVACAVAAFVEFRSHEHRDWRPAAAVAVSPLGFVAFQVWLGRRTGEAGAWFRVQREAWGEGASFGLTAITNTIEAVASPLTSPTDTITAVSLVATLLLLWMGWKARMPWFVTLYSWSIVGLMLVPATVTARPRFLFTAFPLLIGAAKWYDDRRDGDETLWPLTLAASGAGLVALTGLYGVFGAIP